MNEFTLLVGAILPRLNNHVHVRPLRAEVLFMNS